MLIVGVVDSILKVKLPSLVTREGLRWPGVKSLVDDYGWRYRQVPRVLVVTGETEAQIIAPVRRNHGTIIQHYFVSMTPVVDSLFRQVEASHVLIVVRVVVEGVASIESVKGADPPLQAGKDIIAILGSYTFKDRKSTRLNSSHVAISYA